MRSSHYRRTGRDSELEYVPSTRVCRGCQGRLARPHATSSYTRCSCAEGEHYVWVCECGVTTMDPPCDRPPAAPGVGAADYFTGLRIVRPSEPHGDG